MNDAGELLFDLPEPIAVVGNGTIRGQSDAIEFHQTIIRFNNWEAADAEVGHRCDVWCVSCHPNVRFREWPGALLTVYTAAECPGVEAWRKRYPQLAVPPDSWTDQARTIKPLNPSTGLILLLRMVKYRLKFTAFGFDGLRSGHYWEPGYQHTHPDEFSAIAELIRLGVVFR